MIPVLATIGVVVLLVMLAIVWHFRYERSQLPRRRAGARVKERLKIRD